MEIEVNVTTLCDKCGRDAIAFGDGQRPFQNLRSMLVGMTRRLGDESGAAMVEMAFVVILLVMLLLGTITSAVAYGQDNSIQNAAREASRFGATLAGPNDTAWLQSVRDVARAASSGHLDSSVPGEFICVAVGDGTSWESLTDTGGVEAEPDVHCFNDGRPTGEIRVQVVTERDTSIQAVVFDIDVTLSADAAARYERTP
jgi:Flp pilus assembly protein TadG